MKKKEENNKKSKNNKIFNNLDLRNSEEALAKAEADRAEAAKKTALTNELKKLREKYFPVSKSRDSNLKGPYLNFANIVKENNGDLSKIIASPRENLENLGVFILSLIKDRNKELLSEIVTKYLGLDFVYQLAKERKTVAQMASIHGEFDMFDFLIRLKNSQNLPNSDINKKDESGNNLLYYATVVIATSREGDVSLEKVKNTVDYLYSAGIDINSQNSEGSTALHQIAGAIVQKQKIRGFFNGVYIHLITKGAGENIKNRHGMTPRGLLNLAETWIKTASPTEMQEVSSRVKAMFANKGYEDKMSKDRKLILGMIRQPETDLIKLKELLYSVEEDCLSKVNKRGCNLLHFAADIGNDKIFALIVQAKNINAQDKFGMTPIMYAARNKNKNSVFELHNLGADIISPKNILGETLMHYAAKNGWVDVLELMQKNQGGLSARTNRGNMLIHKAAAHNHLKVVNYLLEINQDINATNKSGYTALHIAAEREYNDLFDYLVSVGADTKIKDKYGFLSGDRDLWIEEIDNFEDATEIPSSSSIAPNNLRNQLLLTDVQR